MGKAFVLLVASLIVMLMISLMFTNVASADDTTPPTVTITSNTNVRSCMNANLNMYHCSVPGFTGTATDDIGVVRVTMYYYGPGGPDDVIEYEIGYDPATHQFSGSFCGWDFGPSLYTPVEYCNDLGLDGWCTKAPIPAEGTYLNHLHDCPYNPWCDTSGYHGAQIRAYDAEGNYGYDTFNVDVDTCPYCSNEKPYVCYEWDAFGNMEPKCVDLDTNPNHCGECGNKCGANAHCSGGTCECDEGYKNCDGDWSNGCECSKECCGPGTPNALACYNPANPENGCCAYASCYDGTHPPDKCTTCYGGSWHSGWDCEGGECVPEASTLVLLATGLLFLVGYLGLRRKEN